MVKQKFHSLDVTAIASELRRRLIGLRLQNIYDVSPKVYLLKFAKPEVKELVLVESGIRIHATSYARDKGTYPSGFCMKLRKHLRTKRLTGLRQLGVDRIVDFEFGSGEGAYHVLAEFYAAGNIILTDHEYRILALLRVVAPEENARFAVGEIYPFQLAQQFTPLSMDTLSSLLVASGPKDNLKKYLGAKLDHSSAMVEHCLLEAGLDPSTKCSSLKRGQGLDEDSVQKIYDALLAGDHMVMEAANNGTKGFIFMEELKSTAQVQRQANVMTGGDTLIAYQEFHPFAFRQYAEKYTVKEFESYNKTVDEYFSAIESQKIELKHQAREEAAQKKLESVRKEHLVRIQDLGDALISNDRKARLIEQNLENVDQALLVLRSAIASGMDWIDLKELVEEEKTKNNPVALMIAGLKLETNQVTLRLAEPDYNTEFGFDDDTDDENNGSKECLIDVDLGLSAYANARRYYDLKKVSARKQEKTIQTATKAMKSAESKIRREMKDVPAVVTINKMRKPFWFEKFIWFISNENYLVLGGRDAQQNEFLVKRHFRKGDIYVHADITGSSSVIIKNPTGEAVPPDTLSQAGCMAICHSRAWDAKIVTSAYWVHHDQVSKTAPSGEFLTTGSFMIRGKKNFLPPTQLVYGFGIMFRLADESIPAHFHDRRPHLRGGSATASNESVASSSKTAIEADNEAQSANTLEEIEAKLAAAAMSDSESSDAEPSIPQNEPVEYDRYQLDSVEDIKDTETAVDDLLQKQDNGDDKEKRKYVSAKERRKAKKGTTSTEPTGESNPPPPIAKKTPPSNEAQQKPVRGKKGKMKKLKEKYMDQDDEERELRMELLASAGTVEKTKKKGKKKTTMELPLASSKADIAALQPAPIPKLNQEAEETSAVSRLNGEQDNIQSEQEEEEEVRKLLEEENVPNMEQEDMEDLTYLDSLTGVPLDNDILLAAVAVCAPYSTLQNYKYKLKLQPGSMKKGKAAKAALSAFSAKSNAATTNEKDLIRNIPEHEGIQAMLGKVKIVSLVDSSSKKGNKSKGKGKKK